MSNIIDVTFLSRLVELSAPPGLWSMSRAELLFEHFSLSFRLRSANFRVLTEGLATFCMRRNQSRKRIAALRPARPGGADGLRNSLLKNNSYELNSSPDKTRHTCRIHCILAPDCIAKLVCYFISGTKPMWMCLSLRMKSAPLTCCHVKYPPSYAASVQTNRGGGRGAGEAKTWTEKDGTKRQRRADEGRMREDSGGIYPTGILNFHSSSQTHKQVYIKESRREREREKMIHSCCQLWMMPKW